MWNINNQELPNNFDGLGLSQEQQEQPGFSGPAYADSMGDFPMQFFNPLSFLSTVGDLSNLPGAANFGLLQNVYGSNDVNGNLGGANSSFQPRGDAPDLTRMSSPSQTSQSNAATKLELDARAAELKEKLLKSRSQRDRLNSPSPALEGNKTNNSLQTRQLSSIDPSTDRGSKAIRSPFVPHPLPRQPPQTSIPADANDIAALINSISSTTPTELAATDKTGREERPANLPARPPMPAPENPFSGPDRGNAELVAGKAGEAEKAETSKKPSSSTKPLANPAQNTSPMEEGEISNSPPLNHAEKKKEAVEKALVPHVLPTEPRAARLGASGNKKPHENGPVKSGPAVVNSSPSQRSGEPSKAAPHESRYRSGPDTKGDDTSRTSKLVNKVDHMKPPEPVKKSNEEPDKIGAKATGGSSHPKETRASSHPVPATAEEMLSRLLERDPDLKDWLNFTDYFNVDLRTRKLERYRRNLLLEAEMKRLQAEKQKLQEEEESEMGFIRRPATIPAANGLSVPAPTNVVVASTGIDQISATNPAPQKVVSTTTTAEPAKLVPAKREHDGPESALGRVEKVPRTDDRRSRTEEPEPRSGDEGYRGSERELLPALAQKYHPRPGPPSRGSSPRRPPYRGGGSPPRYDSYRRSPGPPGRSYSPHRNPYPPDSRSRMEYNDYDPPSRGYDGYRSDDGRRGRALSPRRRPSHKKPIHVDLGRPGDTRFFVVKSFNEENVRRCMEDGVWVTQVQNGHIFTTAFEKCKNVILFFSINKSRAFQGYARIISPPSTDTPRSRWMGSLHWDTSPPFRVEWLSTTPVQFFRIRHLKNSLNEGEAVLVGKDGQEIDDECGRGLLQEMESYAELMANLESLGPTPGPDRGSDNGSAPSRWGKKLIKHNDDPRW